MRAATETNGMEELYKLASNPCKKFKDATHDALLNLQSYGDSGATSKTNVKRERDGGDDKCESSFHAKRLKCMTCVSDSIVDMYQCEVLEFKEEVESASESSRKRQREEDDQVCELNSTLIKLSISNGMEEKIRNVTKRFNGVAKNESILQFREHEQYRCFHPLVNAKPDNFLNEETMIYGRDHDKEKVVQLLVSDLDSEFLVIPITGMAGVGKTTLAEFVYNDQTVCQVFNLRGWVCISESFNIFWLIKAIIEALSRNTCHLTELIALQSTLKKIVKGKKVLLVLDNVCKEEERMWESLLLSFIGVDVVRIMIITQTDPAVVKMQATPPYHLGCLSEEQSWLLFQSCAFDACHTNVNENLVAIGKKIVSQCKGFPLAIRTLGMLLRYEIEDEKWLEILHSELWNVDEPYAAISTALRLSYLYMPTHLKPCFLHCSLFPKHHRFSRTQLILLWMAQGFILPQGSRQLEDIGREYFNDLQKRSFFQPIDNPDKKGEELFTMHDLIHDLARYLSRKEYAVTEAKRVGEISVGIRHLHILSSPAFEDSVQFYFIKEPTTLSLHSLLLQDDKWSVFTCGVDGLRVKMLNNLYLNLGCLRMLELKSNRLAELPYSIGNLRHLRYFCLENNRIKRLPDSVCLLYHLQVLDLHCCQSLVELPKGIGNLINLRYLSCYASGIRSLPKSVYLLYNLETLDLQRCESLIEFPSGGGSIGKLVNLQHLKLPGNGKLQMPSGIGMLIKLKTLSEFKVGKDSRHCGIEELSDLVNLRGKLCVSELVNVVSTESAREANLKDKERLEELQLEWSRTECHHNDHKISSSELEERVLESLKPHTNLKKLKVYNYGGASFPTWMGDSLFAKLTKVVLSQCYSSTCEFLPSLGELPSLKSVCIRNMHGVRCIGREFCCNYFNKNRKPVIGFPSLEELRIQHLYGWEEWRGVTDGDFPRLHKLAIENCPKLQSIVTPSSLCSLSLWGLDQLKSIPGIQNLVSLEHLTVRQCPELCLSPPGDRPPPGLLRTRDVHITGCPGLGEWWPCQKITSEVNNWDEAVMSLSKSLGRAFF